jgi:hypothetical protein
MARRSFTQRRKDAEKARKELNGSLSGKLSSRLLCAFAGDCLIDFATRALNIRLERGQRAVELAAPSDLAQAMLATWA